MSSVETDCTSSQVVSNELSARPDDVENGENGRDNAATTSSRATRSKQHKIFVGNIPFKASKWRVSNVFGQFGTVTHTHLVTDRRTGNLKGFGFVTFDSDEAVERALLASGSNLLCLFGRHMRVSRALLRGQPAREAVQTDASQQLQEDGGGECFIQQLPLELLVLILQQLPLKQLVRARRVCWHWHSVVGKCLASLRTLDLRDVFSRTGRCRLSDRTLKQLLIYAPNVQRLFTGGNARSCSHSALLLVARRCRHLVEIDLTGFAIDERSLMALCTRCSQLELVHLPDHYHFSEASVWLLLQHLGRLRRLDLNRSPSVNGQSFSAMPASMEQLVLRECSGLQSHQLALLSDRGLTALHSLDVTAVTSLTTADCRRMLAGLPALRRLSMGRLTLPLDQCLAGCRDAGARLNSLDIGFSTRLTDDVLQRVVTLMPGLSDLDLQGCSALTEAGLLHVQQLGELSRLDVSYMAAVSDAVLDSLLAVPLQYLYAAESYAGRSRFTEAGVQRLVAGARRLCLLDLSCVSVDAALMAVALREAAMERVEAAPLDVRVGGTVYWQQEQAVSQEQHQDSEEPEFVCLENGVRLLDFNSVPLHMRLLDDSEDMTEDWDDNYSSSDDFDDIEAQLWMHEDMHHMLQYDGFIDEHHLFF